MEFTAEQIAGLLNGVVEGNPEAVVSGLSKIEEGEPKSLSFLANPKYEEYIYTTKSTICIVNKTFEPLKDVPETLTLVRVDDAHASFAKLLEAYDQMTKKDPLVEQHVVIADSASVGADPYIGSFSVIKAKTRLLETMRFFTLKYLSGQMSKLETTVSFTQV